MRILGIESSCDETAAAVVEDAGQGGKSVDAELAEIQGLRKTDSKRYWSDATQARELELIAIQQKVRARQSA